MFSKEFRTRISCKNISEKDSNIAMTSRSIKPSKTEVFDWGDNYYNDGFNLLNISVSELYNKALSGFLQNCTQKQAVSVLFFCVSCTDGIFHTIREVVCSNLQGSC